MALASLPLSCPMPDPNGCCTNIPCGPGGTCPLLPGACLTGTSKEAIVPSVRVQLAGGFPGGRGSIIFSHAFRYYPTVDRRQCGLSRPTRAETDAASSQETRMVPLTHRV